jgi:hypothetical protein
LRKKKLARKDAKTQRVFLCTPKNKFTKSLPASGRSLRFSLISLRLCAFARQKTKNLHQTAKGFSNFFASYPLCEKKKKLARKDAKPQRVFPCTPKIKFTKSLPALGRSLRFFPISLRLCAFARQNN